ncbi:MAG: hypothetical protein GXP10_03340, partial [Gammaproteobacteria bacterium]|nr:hypothetical protein [Gammaproteobacteria bacterium]
MMTNGVVMRAVFIALLLVVVAAGCSDQGAANSGGAAPLGQQAVLEKLADSYVAVSEQLPSSPN